MPQKHPRVKVLAEIHMNILAGLDKINQDGPAPEELTRAEKLTRDELVRVRSR